MAVDPYRKSRRIRNVIWHGKMVWASVEAMLDCNFFSLPRKTKKQWRQAITRNLWRYRLTNIFQGGPLPTGENAKSTQDQRAEET